MSKDNEVKIVINADDKASAAFKDLKKNMTDAVKAISDLENEYIAYGDQVKDMSSFSRMSSDETSRMIQLADDAFVEYGSLSMAMKGMVNNGVQPSISGMAALSDKFLSIRDPLAQSQFLIDNFGRSGQDMAKIMELGGSKIQEMAAATSSSLVIDDAKAKKIQDTKVALDAFNDSMTGMKYEAAGALLGIFQQMPQPIQDVTLGIGSMVNGGALASLADMAIIFKNIGGTSTALTATGTALKGVAAGEWAALGPAAAVVAALYSTGMAIYRIVEFFGMLGKMMDELAAKGLVGEFLNQLFSPGVLADAIGKTASLGNVGNALLPGRASGGGVSAGRAYMVGENGPEMMIPGSDGTILPNGFGMGGGMVVNNFNVTYAPFVSTLDREEAKTRLQPIFADLLRSARVG